MRNVRYHVDDSVVLGIRYLRGRLLPTRPPAPPWFDDPASFSIAIDTAVVQISAASLTALLNTYTFNYKDAPLGRLAISVVDGRLRERGTLRKGVAIPFTIDASISATPDGRVRLHPESVKVLGMSVQSLMRRLGLELDKMIRVEPGRGAEIDGNDFLLSPGGLLPPPTIGGRIVAVRVTADGIEQTFAPSARKPPLPRLTLADPAIRNYMLYQGGVLRFGKLTMGAADLEIADADPSDPFDFFLSHLNEQLVAGRSRSEPDFGLLTTMPDYDDMRRAESAPRR